MNEPIKIKNRPKHVWVHPEFVEFYDKYRNILDDCIGVNPSFTQFTKAIAKNSSSILLEIERMKNEKNKTNKNLFKKEKPYEMFSKAI